MLVIFSLQRGALSRQENVVVTQRIFHVFCYAKDTFYHVQGVKYWVKWKLKQSILCFRKVKRSRGMKKILVCLICSVLCIGLTGCGKEALVSQGDAGVVTATEPDSTQVAVETEATQTEALEAAETPQEAGNQSTESEIPFSADFYDYESMADLLGEYGVRFGTALSAYTAQDYTMQALIGQHFNSVTATNEMKAYCLLDAKASRASKDGMPVMNYAGADAIIMTAAEYGAQVRGHVLVWDAYMTDWFFREGYKSNGDYVDRETMKKRMESYITQVITYFEETYPGMVYCWDVVNEAVGDGISDYAEGDPRHIRKYRSGKENLFYKYVGEDYVELAFLYAKNAVEALQKKNPELDIKLFYNDYNTFYEGKRDAICALVESINSYATDAQGNPRKLCDGVGMQGYIGGYGSQNGCLDRNIISMVKNAILKYAELGVEVQITEMAVRNYSDDAADIQRHADYYEELMQKLVEVNSGEEKPLTCIAIWGLTDMHYVDKSSYEYKMNGPYCGLFTSGYEVKDAFYQVYVMLKEKQNIN